MDNIFYLHFYVFVALQILTKIIHSERYKLEAKNSGDYKNFKHIWEVNAISSSKGIFIAHNKIVYKNLSVATKTWQGSQFKVIIQKIPIDVFACRIF